jgi:hypothetical protein
MLQTHNFSQKKNCILSHTLTSTEPTTTPKSNAFSEKSVFKSVSTDLDSLKELCDATRGQYKS